jgi:predicted RNase H-like HicB family nuclease
MRHASRSLSTRKRKPGPAPARRWFSLEYWLDSGWYVGKLREVPGVFSQGRTLRELERNIREAYALMMEDEPVGPENGKVKEIGVPA